MLKKLIITRSQSPRKQERKSNIKELTKKMAVLIKRYTKTEADIRDFLQKIKTGIENPLTSNHCNPTKKGWNKKQFWDEFRLIIDGEETTVMRSFIRTILRSSKIRDYVKALPAEKGTRENAKYIEEIEEFCNFEERNGIIRETRKLRDMYLCPVRTLALLNIKVYQDESPER